MHQLAKNPGILIVAYAAHERAQKRTHEPHARAAGPAKSGGRVAGTGTRGGGVAEFFPKCITPVPS